MVARSLEAAIVAGTLPWLYLTMRSGPAGAEQMYWLPLSDLVRLAAGLLLPVRFAVLASVPRVMAICAVGSLAIELTQLLAQHGRVFSVDDIWLNAAGAGLAAAASRRWWAGQGTVPAGAGDQYGV